jgi:hypothetical protein
MQRGNAGGSKGLNENLEEEFLRKLRDHLLRKYNKPKSKEKYEPCIEKSFYFKSPRGTVLKWGIRASGGYPDVYGDAEGNIFVWLTLAEVSDIIFLSCELDGVKITSEEADDIWKLSVNRDNWKKLENKYRSFVKWLKHAEEIAGRITEETGLKTILHIPRSEEGDRFSFITEFNSRNMSDENKMRIVEKAVDALIEYRREV